MVDKAVLKWLRKQGTIISMKISLDRLYLLDRLVEEGVFKNRSKAIQEAIDELLKRYYPELLKEDATLERFGDFVRADVLEEVKE